MVNPRTTVLGVALLILCSVAHGRTLPTHLRFRHYSLAQGLSQSSVNSIVQDRQGYMWIGTQDGLNRFDGYSFTVFRHNPQDSTSILDNYVWSVTEDQEGGLWAGTLNGGLNRYDPVKGGFTRFVHRGGDSSSLSGDNVTALCISRSGELLVGTWGGGLQSYDRGTGQFHRIPVANPWVQCILQDHTGRLWVGTPGGLEVLDTARRVVARYRHDAADGWSLGGDHVTALLETSAGDLWVGTLNSGLEKLRRDNAGFIHFRHLAQDPRSLTDDRIRCLGEDRAGRLWVGTEDGGVDVLEPDSLRFTHFRADPYIPDAISSDRVFSMYRDDTGGMWVGSADAGVSRFDPWAQRFSHIRSRPDDPHSLSGSTVRAMVYTREGELWVGTWGGGLNRLLPGTHEFQHYRHRAEQPSSLGSDAILSLHEGRNGDLWIGTSDAGMDRFDRARNVFVHYRHEPRKANSLANDAVMAIEEDRNGVFWIGTSGGGVDRFEPGSGSFRNYRPREGDPSSISGVNVWAIHEDRYGKIWMGTWGMGLDRFDPDSGTFRRYLHDPANANSLSNNTVWSVAEDREGILWLGTWGGGLDRFDPRTGEFHAFTEADGLPNNVVYGILPDERGNLWLSTNKGISRFNPGSMTFKNYDALDGLQGDEFNQGAYCRGKNGRLFFGGVNGFSTFMPDSISDNPYPPPIVLTSFMVFNRPIPLGPYLRDDKPITLSYQENFFSFEFSALSYTVPEKNQYAYMMEGFDRDWVPCGTRRYVSYTHLDGGDYVFRVKGSNNDGLWNDAGTAVRIHVEPPFYRTAWFLIALVAVGAGAAYAVYRFQVNKLLEMERLRTRIASDLHDDIGSGLTRIAVLSDVASVQILSLVGAQPGDAGGTEDEHGVTMAVQKVGNIARELVDAMSDVVWSIDPRHESAETLVQRIRAYAYELCEAKGMSLAFEAAGAAEATKLSPETLRGILLFTKEAVTNIVRHSRGTSAAIRVKFGRKQIHIEVSDDGRGFDPASVRAGNGLANMRSRAEKAGGSFAVTTGGSGTTLSIVLPIV